MEMATSVISRINDFSNVRMLSTGDDLDTLTGLDDCGVYYIRGGVSHTPQSYCYMLCLTSSLGLSVQVIFDQSSSNGIIYIRKCLANQPWMPWKSVTLS